MFPGPLAIFLAKLLPLSIMFETLQHNFLLGRRRHFLYNSSFQPLMAAATLIFLCTRPLEVSVFGQLPWVLTVPSIAIIGRKVKKTIKGMMKALMRTSFEI